MVLYVVNGNYETQWLRGGSIGESSWREDPVASSEKQGYNSHISQVWCCTPVVLVLGRTRPVRSWATLQVSGLGLHSEILLSLLFFNPILFLFQGLWIFHESESYFENVQSSAQICAGGSRYDAQVILLTTVWFRTNSFILWGLTRCCLLDRVNANWCN